MSWRSLSQTKGYILFVLMRVISSIIIWIDFTCIFSNISFYWHADPFIIGVCSALYGVPGLLLGPFIGHLADRWGPYKILTLSYAFRSLTSLMLFMTFSVTFFIVFVFIKSIGNLGVMPAEQLLIKHMLDKEQIIDNASILTIIDQFTKIFSPLIMVAITLYFTPNYGFFLSFIMAIMGFVLIFIMQYRLPYLNSGQSIESIKRNIKVIKSMFIENLTFRHGLIFSLFQSLILGLYDPMLTIILREQGHGAEAFGSVVSATAVGALLGAIIFKRLFLNISTSLTTLSMAGFGLSIFVPGLLGTLNIQIALIIFIMLWVLNGACYALTAMNFNVILQHETSKNLIGIVSATLRSAQLFMIIIGPLVGAVFAHFIGVNQLFTICGAIALLFSLAFIIVHPNKGTEIGL